MKMVAQDTQTDITVSPEIFDYEYHEGLIHQAVVAYLNGARSGNSAQKTRAEVRGGGRKPWKQKGTGRARAGTIRSPLWRSGGVTFASKKRDYTQKINKKMYRRAMRSILSELYRRGDLVVVSQLELDSHRTKDFLGTMQKLSLDNALLVMTDVSEEIYLGSRNLGDFAVLDTYSVDPVALLSYKKVLFTQDALKTIEEQLQ